MGARMTGKAGAVKIGGVKVASLTAWSLDAKLDTPDATGFEDEWKVLLGSWRNQHSNLDCAPGSGSGNAGPLPGHSRNGEVFVQRVRGFRNQDQQGRGGNIHRAVQGNRRGNPDRIGDHQ